MASSCPQPQAQHIDNHSQRANPPSYDSSCTFATPAIALSLIAPPCMSTTPQMQAGGNCSNPRIVVCGRCKKPIPFQHLRRLPSLPLRVLAYFHMHPGEEAKKPYCDQCSHTNGVHDTL